MTKNYKFLIKTSFMRRTLLLFAGLAVGMLAKAQVEMVVNSIDSVRSDRSGEFYEFGTNPSSITAGDDFIIYDGNLNFYEYWSKFMSDTVFNSRYISEIYVSQGTAETTMAIDFNPVTSDVNTDLFGNEYVTPRGSSMQYPFYFKGQLYFKATNGVSTGLYTITKDADTTRVADWFPYNVQVVGDKVYMADGDGDRPILSWDGVSAYPDSLPNMDGVIDGQGIFYVFGDMIIQKGDLYDSVDMKTEVIFYDMTTSESFIYEIAEGSAESNPDRFIAGGENVFFRARNTDKIYGIYISDGTAEGTRPIETINNYFASTSSTSFMYGADMYYWEGNLYFSAEDTLSESYGRQIYQYNLAGDTLHRLTEYMEDGEYVHTGFSDPVEFDGMLYFASSINYYSYLCRTDGNMVEILDTTVIGVSDLCPMGGKLYFSGEVTNFNQYNDTTLLSSGNELMVYTPLNTSISRVNEYKAISVYPNPTNGTISLSAEVSNMASYEVYDLSGKKVMAGLVGNGTIHMDVNKGVYMLRVVDGNTQMVSKVMVK